jgi:hypothetical protein
VGNPATGHSQEKNGWQVDVHMTTEAGKVAQSLMASRRTTGLHYFFNGDEMVDLLNNELSEEGTVPGKIDLIADTHPFPLDLINKGSRGYAGATVLKNPLGGDKGTVGLHMGLFDPNNMRPFGSLELEETLIKGLSLIACRATPDLADEQKLFMAKRSNAFMLKFAGSRLIRHMKPGLHAQIFNMLAMTWMSQYYEPGYRSRTRLVGFEDKFS